MLWPIDCLSVCEAQLGRGIQQHLKITRITYATRIDHTTFEVERPSEDTIGMSYLCSGMRAVPQQMKNENNREFYLNGPAVLAYEQRVRVFFIYNFHLFAHYFVSIRFRQMHNRRSRTRTSQS